MKPCSFIQGSFCLSDNELIYWYFFQVCLQQADYLVHLSKLIHNVPWADVLFYYLKCLLDNKHQLTTSN